MRAPPLGAPPLRGGSNNRTDVFPPPRLAHKVDAFSRLSRAGATNSLFLPPGARAKVWPPFLRRRSGSPSPGSCAEALRTPQKQGILSAPRRVGAPHSGHVWLGFPVRSYPQVAQPPRLAQRTLLMRCRPLSSRNQSAPKSALSSTNPGHNGRNGTTVVSERGLCARVVTGDSKP